MPIIVENVSHIYMKDTPFEAAALRDINMTIGDGDFIGIIGHTGSGKSTLVQHLNSLLKPTSGRIKVDGIDLSEKGVDIREIRRRVGLVFQYPEHQLFEETIAKDIAFGPRNLNLSDAEVDSRVRESMEWVGLSYEEFAERSPFDLSGGQKRRVAIAGVLSMRPHTLILDEPTAGLDPRGRREILDLVLRFHKNGDTVLLVTHAMDDIARLANRVVVMNKARLVMDDVPEAVFSQGQKLLDIGLGIPFASHLVLELLKRGIELPGSGICSMDVLKERLHMKLSEKQRN